MNAPIIGAKPRKKVRPSPARASERATASEIRSALGVTAAQLNHVRQVLRELGMQGAK